MSNQEATGLSKSTDVTTTTRTTVDNHNENDTNTDKPVESRAINDSTSAANPSSISSHPSLSRAITILPQDVVDQIAAGEVVQRPASVVKELLENCLDAGSTRIVIKVERGGLSKITITDNGKGIPKQDLALAATRHATSKLRNVHDFQTLQTFGFRGEALASISMVSHLTIISRTPDSPVAYTQTYRNGFVSSLLDDTSSQQLPAPKPVARTPGTTLIVQDLFYNVPHRLNTYSKREGEEYQKILAVVQQYAIRYPHCGFCLERKLSSSNQSAKATSNKKSSRATPSKMGAGATLVDVNTTQIPAVIALMNQQQKTHDAPTTSLSVSDPSQPQQTDIDSKRVAATKAVMAHVLEPQIEPHIVYLKCHFDADQQNGSKDGINANKDVNTKKNSTTQKTSDFAFQAEMFVTAPSYALTNKKLRTTSTSNAVGNFILFLNDRLVDLPVLKRMLEDVHSEFTSKHPQSKQEHTQSTNINKPILVVSVRVPGSQVDVNVHPSKRQVALMYQDEICTSLTNQLRKALQEQGQSFQAQSVAPTVKSKGKVHNPYASTSSTLRKRKRMEQGSESDQEEEETKNEEKIETPKKNGNKSLQPETPAPPNSSTKLRRTPPSQLIRTSKATPVGAIEPYLVLTSTPLSAAAQIEDSTPSLSGNSQESIPFISDTFPHKDDCPLASNNIDLSQPGAFALTCTCAPSATQNATSEVHIKRPTVVRPKRVIPTKCSLSSIQSLRKRVNKYTNTEMARQLRDAHFVGVVSHFRSLIQCGEVLVMIHHMELAKQLFYQLALARFGGATMAQLGGSAGNGGINVHTVITQALQLEDDLVLSTRNNPEQQRQDKLSAIESRIDLLDTNDTNKVLAEQATACLLDHADMLEEYFSIRIEKRTGPDSEVVLTALPVLLEGHTPEPHGLAIFLLRLATQVEWAEERPCFHGICRELGNYYAMLPTHANDVVTYVHHTLFPAISYLLLPSEHHKSDGNFTNLTNLSTLYKVFERC